jgi:Riboflavin synthase alpha chain
VSAIPDANTFEVCIIPTTWRETSLSERAPGAAINLETDILGRYVEKFVCSAATSSAASPREKNLSLETLLSAGFAAQ